MSALVSIVSTDPSPGDASGRPVMLLLHGYGSNERDLPALTPYLPPLPWVSVRAPLPMPAGGASWFELSLPDEPAQAAIAGATDALWEWIDAELDQGSPLVPVGFSQGGLMATQLLRSRPERVAATVVLAGFVAAEPQSADAALERSRPPVFWGRGLADPVIWPAAIERTAAVLARLTSVTERVYPGLGHGVGAPMLEDVRAFLERELST